MIAFGLSLVIALVGFLGALRYGKRRRVVGQPLSWGEAIAAAGFAFALMFWSYGVVPHQWLTWVGNELQWRPDRQMIGWHFSPLFGDEGLVEYLLPFSVNWENIAHIGAVAIYGLFLTLHVVAWAVWQDRAKARPAAIATSEYGRPLVKQG